MQKLSLKLIAAYFLLLISFYFTPSVYAQTDRTVTYRDTSYQGKYVSQDVPDPIEIMAGETKEVTITFKNTGVSAWTNTGKHYVSLYTVNPKYIASNFAGKDWIANNNPAKINAPTAPGKTTTLTIKLHAPKRAATYKEEFTLVAENTTWIKGTYFYLLIKVVPADVVTESVETSASTTIVTTSTSGVTTDATATELMPMEVLPTRDLIPEPLIRVNLYKTPNTVRFTSVFPYDVVVGGEVKGTITNGTLVAMTYSDGTYHLVSDGLTLDSPTFIRLVPHDDASYFALLNYDHHVGGRGDTNFNMFRGSLEYRLNPKTKELLIINELPLEQYVRGLAETSNESATEYLRAIVIAARTYGYMRIKPVSDNHLYDVVPTTVDQVYLGYYSEALMPNVMQAVADTAGLMVTYKGNTIITYYFGHSNGKTKDGGAARPWLKSVKAIYDKGRSMYGHGLGMSCADAAMHAMKDGWTYNEILKYYYTGVEIEKFY